MHRPVWGLLVHLALALALVALALVGPDRERDDRGDVPGWVMVTLMTAIVVAALTPFVSEQLLALLRQAFTMVGG